MSEPRAVYTRAGRRTTRTPRRTLSLIALAIVGIAVWLFARGGGQEAASPDPAIAITVDKQVVLRIARDSVQSSTPRELRERLRAIPARRRARRDRAVITLQTDFAGTASGLRRAAREGGNTVAVADRPVSSTISLPVIKQRLRNNCESAALSMLLLARGREGGQLQLQRQLPRSGPLDPRTGRDGSMVWGDPREGFVGRPDGGGTAGGYGVYEKPVAALAKRQGLTTTDLSGRPASRVYEAVRKGRPVMVWIGLTDGPFKTWRTPAGTSFTGNFGEHTVVLTGITGDRLAVNDPLSGKRLSWSRSQFELMWKRLGQRALAA